MLFVVLIRKREGEGGWDRLSCTLLAGFVHLECVHLPDKHTVTF